MAIGLGVNIYSKNFYELNVQDKAWWLIGNMLCSDYEDTPELAVGDKSIVLVKIGEYYAVVYQFYDYTDDDHKLERIGFKDLKDLYNYLLKNCREWYIDLTEEE